jgi:hypothetical protein
MSINTSQRASWPVELSGVMTGSVVAIGTLVENPVILIFDNQATVDVAISVNDSTGSKVWKTFVAGEALVLDLRDKAHLAANFTADLGTTFYGSGASGTFRISYIAALNTGG